MKTNGFKELLLVWMVLLSISGGGVRAAPFDAGVKLVASDGGPGDCFGNTVAIDGNTLVVGACYADLFSGTGSAYVFVRNGSNWVEQAKLTASDAGPDQWFGWSLAIDGDTIAVGSVGVTDAGSRSGAVYLFTRKGPTWTQQTRLTASDNSPGLFFGTSVAINGNRLVVGAEGDSGNGPWTGAAYVFKHDAGVWTQESKLQAAGAMPYDYFGYAVAIEKETILVGAQEYPDRTGSVHVFGRHGGSWVEQAKLTPSDGSAGDTFGCSVALSGDLAAVGSMYNGSVAPGAGAVYLFKRTGQSWQQQAKLAASDGTAGDLLGFTVGLSDETVVSGAFLQNGMAGAAYVFGRARDGWAQQQKLVASDRGPGDHFGQAVGISRNTIVVGAFEHPGGSFIGTAYVYTRDTRPPVIRDVRASPNLLSPPDGSLVPVTVTVVATDNLDPSPRSRIIAVACNDTSAQEVIDWIVTGDLTLQLRAITASRGAERIYAIRVQCVDSADNAAFDLVKVRVPRSW